MNSEFSPLPENTVTPFKPVDLDALEKRRMMTKFQVLTQEAKDMRTEDPVFRDHAERLDVIGTQFSEIQKQALDVLYAHNIPVDEETTIEDYEIGLDNVREFAKGLGIALEHGQWEPNVWRKELGNDRYKRGFELLRAAVKAKEGATAADYKSRLLTRIGNRGLGVSGGGNTDSNRVAIANLCREIDSLAGDPSTIWKVFTERGIIPDQLVEDTEGMVNMMQIYKICNEIEVADLSTHYKKLLRADALSSYIDKGVNAVLIDEVIEGRYSFDSSFFNSVVEGIAGIESVAVKEKEYSRKKEVQMEKKEREWLQKDIKRMAVTSVMAWSILTGNYAFTNQKVSPEAITAAAGDLASHVGQLPDWVGSKIQETVKSVQQGLTSPPGEAEPVKDYSNLPEMRSEKNAAKKKGGEHKVATNVRANDFLQSSKVVDWDVEGDTSGYFKLGTSSTFDYQDHTWADNFDDSPLSFSITSDHTDTVLKKNILVTDNDNVVVVDLPVLYDEFVNTGNIVIAPVSSSGQSITDFKTDVFFNRDGSYRMEIRGLGKGLKSGEKISLRVGLTKFDTSNPPADLKAYLNYELGPSSADTEFLFDRSYLPDDVKEVVKSIRNNKDLNDKQKAQVLSEWMRRTFTYSLDNRWENFYNEADSPANYFQRILSNKKVTCEGANTALAIVARSMGLPTRLAWGYMNNGIPIFPIPAELTENKAHAWVEVYAQDKVTGKGEWVKFDGTPTKMDPTTLRALAQLLAQGQEGMGLSGLNDLLNISIDRLGDEAFLYLATIEEFVRQHSTEIFSGASLVVGAAYLAGMASVTRMRRTLESSFRGQRKIFMNKITAVATTPNMISHTFLSHADRMFRDFSQKNRIEYGEYGGLASGLTQVINPKLLWRLQRSRTHLAEQTRILESMSPIKHHEELSNAVAQATGTDVGAIEESMIHDNRDMLEKEARDVVERQANAIIYCGHFQIAGIGDNFDWKMEIYTQRALKKAHSFEDFYADVTKEAFRYRRKLLQQVAKSPKEERELFVQNSSVPLNIPPNNREALAAFRQSIASDFARPAWVMWKYAKKAV